MGKFLSISIFFICLSFGLTGQSLKRIAKSIDKNEFEKANELIQKGLEKDTANFGLYYFKSIYFLNNSISQYNLDSARICIEKSLALRKNSTEDQRDDWLKTERSETLIDSTKIAVIDLTFQREQLRLSAGSMKYFLKLFPNSHLEKKAIALRDSIAFEDAKKISGWKNYELYMDEYPDSKYFYAAKKRYDSLLFEDKTKSKTLDSYVAFLSTYPSTPYRNESEAIIFKKMTIDHDPENYKDFISEYPNSYLRGKSADILYYQFKAGAISSLSDILIIHPRSDSLIKLHGLEEKTLIPVSLDGGFGFMDNQGVMLSALKYDELSSAYNCGNVTTEWLLVKSDDKWNAINRVGNKIVSNVTAIDEVGDELVIVGTSEGSRLYHKSGFPIATFEVLKANVIFNKWIGFQSKKHWGLMTFSGEVVIEPKYDEILQEGAFTIIATNNKYLITNKTQLDSLTKLTDFTAKFTYTDYEIINDSLVLGIDESKECLINSRLTQIVALKEHEINFTKNITYTKAADGFRLYDNQAGKLMDTTVKKLKKNDSWLAVKDSLSWKLIPSGDPMSRLNLEVDSVNFIDGNFAFVQKNDSSFILFDSAKMHYLKESEKYQLLSDGNSFSTTKRFLLKSDKTNKRLLDQSGMIVFEGKADEIKYLNDSLIIMVTRGKYGIYQLQKGYLKKPIYDGMNSAEGLVLLLKNNLIGCHDLSNNATIPPEYQSRIERFGDNYVVVKNNKVGVIDQKQQLIIPFDYDELLAWNDTSYLAKKDSEWSLRSYHDATILKGIQNISKWNNYEDEEYYQINVDGKYGIIHPSKGILVPARYNEIINLNTSASPLFFAEEHLEAADFYVVTYFDSAGETIKSQAYRPSEYQLIYCDL